MITTSDEIWKYVNDTIEIAIEQRRLKEIEEKEKKMKEQKLLLARYENGEFRSDFTRRYISSKTD